MLLISWLEDLTNLIFPNICKACGKSLNKGEIQICTLCRYEIPRTNFNTLKKNNLAKVFWGRVDIKNITASFFYQKQSKLQQLIHAFKYKGHGEVAEELGKYLGQDLLNSPFFSEIDYIIPVPLHPKREKYRGYNQSLLISKGVEKIFNRPILTNILHRKIHTKSQTKLKRFERWENSEAIYGIKNEHLIEGKHILLIDDVITTGSTIEACASLLINKKAKVSVASLAFALN